LSIIRFYFDLSKDPAAFAPCDVIINITINSARQPRTCENR